MFRSLTQAPPLSDPAAGAVMEVRVQPLMTGGSVLAVARLVLDLAARQWAQGLAQQLGVA